ncbi:acyl-CoA dehydrogenase family protein [Streptomyces sp. NPDC002067]
MAALHELISFETGDIGLCSLVAIHYNLFLGGLFEHDGATRDLRDFVAMRRTGTFLCTEVAHGNGAAALETTASYDPDTRTFVLHTPSESAVKFMPNTSSLGGPKTAVVAARLLVGGEDEGVFMFLTPIHDDAGDPLPGISIRPLPQTMTAPLDHCVTSFDHVRLPYEAMLQADHGRLLPDGTFTSSVGNRRKRFLASLGRVTPGKLTMSAIGVGSTRHAVAVAVRYAHQRHASGVTAGPPVPLFAYRSHHGPLLDAVAATYAMTLLHRMAVRRWAEAGNGGADREDAERLIAIVKGWVTWRARAVITECRERCGAHGLFLANGMAAQITANEGAITAEGDNLVIWVKAAGEMLLGNFTPRPRSDVPATEQQLTDPDTLQKLLTDIERIWHHRARTRLRAPNPGGPLGRWNRTVGHALQLVDAHGHRLAAEGLLTAAREAADPQAAELLYGLHRLFALRRVAAHGGDLLADDCLTTEQVRELPDRIDEVLGELAPHGLTLAEGVGAGEEALSDHPITIHGSGRLAY